MTNLEKPRECCEFLITIRGGRNLENRKLIGTNAPFVEVSMGNEIRRTLTTQNLEDPNWNEAIGFKFNERNEMPNQITIRVKDENALLPNPILGEYNLILDKEMLMKEYQQQPTRIINDGFVNLENCNKGELNFQLMFKYYGDSSASEQSSRSEEKNRQVSKMEFEKRPEELNQQSNLNSNSKKNEMKSETKKEETEKHVLPPVQVTEKPTIIEKEVEYHKPVEIKEKVIHKEKPIIVEQPIINEKFEKYEEKPRIYKNEKKLIKESIHEKDVGNLEQKELENLREKRQREFMDTSPNIQHEKEHVQLEKEVCEKPTKVMEKNVLYQQPVEINKTYVEKVHPKVHEDIRVEKEHVHKKLAPEMKTENVQTIKESDEQRLKKEEQMNTRQEVRNQ